MKPSILRNLLIASLAFGLTTGAVFPFFAEFFVEIEEGMFTWFAGSCLIAGALIGVSNYWLVNVILLIHSINSANGKPCRSANQGELCEPEPSPPPAAATRDLLPNL